MSAHVREGRFLRPARVEPALVAPDQAPANVHHAFLLCQAGRHCRGRAFPCASSVGPAWKALQRLVYFAAPGTLLHWMLVHNDFGSALVHFMPLTGLETYRIPKCLTATACRPPDGWAEMKTWILAVALATPAMTHATGFTNLGMSKKRTG